MLCHCPFAGIDLAWLLIIHSASNFLICLTFWPWLPAPSAGLHLCSPSLCRQDRSAGRYPTWVWCGVYARYGASPAPFVSLPGSSFPSTSSLSNQNCLWLTSIVTSLHVHCSSNPSQIEDHGQTESEPTWSYVTEAALTELQLLSFFSCNDFNSTGACVLFEHAFLSGCCLLAHPEEVHY